MTYALYVKLILFVEKETQSISAGTERQRLPFSLVLPAFVPEDLASSRLSKRALGL
jgi:hypothetical protein